MKAKLVALMAIAASAAFGGALDTAWIKGTTDKDPLTYKPGEEMVFKLEPQALSGEIPAGYFLEWTRSGDDGIREGGKIPFTAEPFVYKTKIDKPGFVRIQACVVAADGKRFCKRYLGDTTTPEGKAAMNRFERTNKAVFCDGGAGADTETVRTEPAPTRAHVVSVPPPAPTSPKVVSPDGQGESV